MLEISGTSNSASQAAGAVASTTGATANAVATAVGTGGAVGSTNFTSLQDFQNKYPTAYKAMMDGMASGIVSQIKADSDRLIAEMKKMNPQ